MVPLGAALGYGLSGLALPALPFVLALAGGTLIYVTSNEIIPESHSHGHEGTQPRPVSIAGFLLTMCWARWCADPRSFSYPVAQGGAVSMPPPTGFLPLN
jgi:zinc transporter ZupT